MTDPAGAAAGRPVLQELGGFYNLVIDGENVIMCLRHIAIHIRDDGTAWRPRPVVLDDGTTWSPLPPPRNAAHDRVPLAVGGTFERQLREWPPPGGGAGER